jgi:hypothetical protein
VVGHLAYHYRSRVREAVPDPNDLPAQLLTVGGYDAMVWLPFPHQNLGVLAGMGKEGQDFGELLGAVMELAGAEAPTVPRFGPFALPPAREMILAADMTQGADGDAEEPPRFLMAARVYPGPATVARAAGKVAGNPWLGGGVVELGDRRVEIRWHGTLWMVLSPPGDIPRAGALTLDPVEFQPALAEVRLAHEVGVLPRGSYTVQRTASGVRLALLGQGGTFPVPEGGDPSALAQAPLSLLATTGSRNPRAWMLFQDAPVDGGRVGVAFLSASGKDLDGGIALAALLGEDGYRGRAAGWGIQAAGERNFRRTGALVPDLKRLLRAWETPKLRLAVAAAPTATHAALGQVEEGLRRLTPAGAPPRERPDSLRRLQALQRLTAPLTEYAHLRLFSAREPDRFEVVLDKEVR